MVLKNDDLFNNALNAIISNDKLSKHIEETIKNIDRQIEAREDSQNYLFSQLQQKEDLKGNLVSPMIHGQNMVRVNKPYFLSKTGLTPFTSEIIKRKQDDRTFNFYTIKYQSHKICNERDLDILKCAISRHIRDIEYNRLKISRMKNSDKNMYLLKYLSEDDILKRCDSDMINKIDWLMISVNELKGKLSPEDCKRICDKVINPNFLYTKWTEQENQQLLKLTSDLGSQGKWTNISEQLTIKRQPFACFKQWLELSKKIESSIEWASEEDDLLCDIVRKFNYKNQKISWNEISLLIPDRSTKDCERRWNSIQNLITIRPFTQEDDYKLLVIIKRFNAENWGDIAREMDQRTIEECQNRFSEIIDELCEWTYLEDRRLWLTLRPYYKQLWEEDRQSLGPTEDLTIYKSIIKDFNGRYAIVLRFRYAKLCKWFQLWNLFYLQVNANSSRNAVKTLSLLSENVEDRAIVMNDLSRILIQSSFFSLVRESLLQIGSKNPDKDAHDLILMTNNGSNQLINDLMLKSGNIKLKNLMCCLIDIKNGNFIPLKYDDYVDYTFRGLKYPEKAHENLLIQGVHVRNFEAKIAVTETIRTKMKAVLDNNTVDEEGRKYICKLIDCEGLFTSAFNYATNYLEKTNALKFTDKANKIHQLLPEIIYRMIDYVHRQEQPVLTTLNITPNKCNKTKVKLENIANLLINRELIPSIYKSYLSSEKRDRCLITSHIPITFESYLTKESHYNITSKNIFKSLASNMKFPDLDSKISTKITDIKENFSDIKLITPCQNNLHFLRNFLLQKTQLLRNGYHEFTKMIKLEYDNPAECLRNKENVDKSSILSDQKYSLLKSRLISTVAISSLSSKISPNGCITAGDVLHQKQNNVNQSTIVSESFNNVEYKPRKFQPRSLSQIRKNSYLDEFSKLDLPNSSIIKFSNHTPLTRNCRNNWLKIYLPDKNRSFFISRAAVQNIMSSNFEIFSINNVNVEDFIN